MGSAPSRKAKQSKIIKIQESKPPADDCVSKVPYKERRERMVVEGFINKQVSGTLHDGDTLDLEQLPQSFRHLAAMEYSSNLASLKRPSPTKGGKFNSPLYTRGVSNCDKCLVGLGSVRKTIVSPHTEAGRRPCQNTSETNASKDLETTKNDTVSNERLLQEVSSAGQGRAMSGTVKRTLAVYIPLNEPSVSTGAVTKKLQNLRQFHSLSVFRFTKTIAPTGRDIHETDQNVILRDLRNIGILKKSGFDVGERDCSPRNLKLPPLEQDDLFHRIADKKERHMRQVEKNECVRQEKRNKFKERQVSAKIRRRQLQGEGLVDNVLKSGDD